MMVMMMMMNDDHLVIFVLIHTKTNTHTTNRVYVCMYVGVALCWFQAKEMVLKYLVFQALLSL